MMLGSQHLQYNNHSSSNFLKIENENTDIEHNYTHNNNGMNGMNGMTNMMNDGGTGCSSLKGLLGTTPMLPHAWGGRSSNTGSSRSAFNTGPITPTLPEPSIRQRYMMSSTPETQRKSKSPLRNRSSTLDSNHTNNTDSTNHTTTNTNTNTTNGNEINSRRRSTSTSSLNSSVPISPNRMSSSTSSRHRNSQRSTYNTPNPTTPLARERVAFRAAMASAERRNTLRQKIQAEEKVEQLSLELQRTKEMNVQLKFENSNLKEGQAREKELLSRTIGLIMEQATQSSSVLRRTTTSTNADIVRTSTRRGRNSYYKRLGF